MSWSSAAAMWPSTLPWRLCAGVREQVTLVCLEQLDEMPAYREEVESAVAEGIEVKPGWGPRRIVGGRMVEAVELVRCDSVFDDWGSFDPAYCESVTEVVEADQVIVAIGQRLRDAELPAEDWVFTGGDVDGTGGHGDRRDGCGQEGR